MSDQRELVMSTLERTEAMLTGHFPLTSGRHSDRYVNKDAVSVYPQETNVLAHFLAQRYSHQGVEVVCAAAVGSITLGVLTALALGQIEDREVRFVYAEHGEMKIIKAGPEGATVQIAGEDFPLLPGDELLIKSKTMELRRGYQKIVPGTKVLLVEDILTTGGSAISMALAVHQLQLDGGEIIALGCLCNRGNVAAEAIGVPEIFALAEVEMDSWEPGDCPLCKEGKPLTPVK